MSQFIGSRGRRLGALVATSALAVSGVSLLTAPAQAATADPRPITVGATWLAGQLTNGVLSGTCGQYDCGVTLDAGTALIEAGAPESVVDAIGSGFDTVAKGYFEPGDLTTTGSYSAGATAKTLAFGLSLATPKTTFAGIDLVTRLRNLVSTTPNIAGRIEDISTFNGVPDPSADYANVVGQAFAASALFGAAPLDATTTAVRDFLLTQQCDDGFFRLFYKSDPDTFAPDKTGPQDCQSGVAGGQSAPDEDTTSTVIRLLLPQRSTAAVATAIADAKSWLLAQQRADGSFGGGQFNPASNTNSTGLAGWALGELGELGDTAAAAGAAKAAVWVRKRQADEVSGCTNGLSTQRGAIGLADDAVSAALTGGIAENKLAQWQRSTAGAMPVLQYAPAATSAFNLDGPDGFLKAGSNATYKVSGAAAGDKVCVTAFGAARRLVVGTDGKASTTFKLPAGTASRKVGARTPAGNAASVFSNILGAKTLSVAAPAKVTRGKKALVTVRGLKGGERVTITYRGKQIRSGLANPQGVYTVRFPVGTTLGKAIVRATGKFADIRKGSDTLKVVR